MNSIGVIIPNNLNNPNNPNNPNDTPNHNIANNPNTSNNPNKPNNPHNPNNTNNVTNNPNIDPNNPNGRNNTKNPRSSHPIYMSPSARELEALKFCSEEEQPDGDDHVEIADDGEQDDGESSEISEDGEPPPDAPTNAVELDEADIEEISVEITSGPTDVNVALSKVEFETHNAMQRAESIELRVLAKSMTLKIIFSTSTREDQLILSLHAICGIGFLTDNAESDQATTSILVDSAQIPLFSTRTQIDKKWGKWNKDVLDFTHQSCATNLGRLRLTLDSSESSKKGLIGTVLSRCPRIKALLQLPMPVTPLHEREYIRGNWREIISVNRKASTGKSDLQPVNENGLQVLALVAAIHRQEKFNLRYAFGERRLFSTAAVGLKDFKWVDYSYVKEKTNQNSVEAESASEEGQDKEISKVLNIPGVHALDTMFFFFPFFCGKSRIRTHRTRITYVMWQVVAITPCWYAYWGYCKQEYLVEDLKTFKLKVGGNKLEQSQRLLDAGTIIDLHPCHWNKQGKPDITNCDYCGMYYHQECFRIEAKLSRLPPKNNPWKCAVCRHKKVKLKTILSDMPALSGGSSGGPGAGGGSGRHLGPLPARHDTYDSVRHDTARNGNTTRAVH